MNLILWRKLGGEALEYAFLHAKTCYPEECCGLFLEEIQRVEINLFLPLRNQQNRLHLQDPKGFSQSAQEAYFVDPKEVEQLSRFFEPTHRIVGIVHSHVDAAVYFSEIDRKMAHPWATLENGPGKGFMSEPVSPLFPDWGYVVIGVRDRQIEGASLFWWNESQNRYEEEPLK